MQHRNVLTSSDSADVLYEYVPLGIEEWMPPVDAVYRPHVVHHTAPMSTSGSLMGGSNVTRPKLGGAKNQRCASRDSMMSVGLGLAGVATSGAS